MTDVTFGASDNERLARLVVLRKEAADALRLPADHYRVRQLAAYHLNHETLLARLIDGDNTVTDRIASVAAAIDAMTPELPPDKIKLEIMPSGPAVCPQCGWTKPDVGVVVNPNGESMFDGLRNYPAALPDCLTREPEPDGEAPPAATAPAATAEPPKAPRITLTPEPQRVAPDQSPVVWFGSRKDLYK